MSRSIKNIVYGVLGQVITIVIGLLLPRLRIVSYGSEVNGLLSSVQQIFVYLALLEAGIGTATLQSLYGPIATGDKGSVNEILAATHRYYKRTGYIYLGCVLLLAVVYPLFVHSDVAWYTVVLVILFNGLGNVLAYFFQAKYRILLQAEGKQYIVTNLATMVTLFSGMVKIVLISAGFGIVSLQFVYFLCNIIQVLYFAFYINKHYRWINLRVKPNEKAIAQKNSVLVHQISQLVFNNTDMLLLTLFCNLKLVSVYALYNMIYDMVSTLINNVNTGFTFKLGQLFNTDKERFLRLYDLYERYYTAFSFALYTVAFLLIMPFIKLYTKGVEDVDYAMAGLPVLFTAIKLMVSGRAPSGFIASFAQRFKETQNRAIIEMVINLSVSLICVNVFGIYGVLMGTVAALLYRANDMIIYANMQILQTSPWRTYKWWVMDLTIFAVTVILTNRLSLQINSYREFFLTGAIYSALILIIYLVVTAGLSFKDTKELLRSLKQNGI